MLGWIAYQCGGWKKPITIDGDEHADVSSLLLLVTAPCSKAEDKGAQAHNYHRMIRGARVGAWARV
jgi:hypothetical protein